MKKPNRMSLLPGAALLAALLIAGPVRAAENEWPGTKVGEPTPKVKSMPAVLARNLGSAMSDPGSSRKAQ